MWTPYDTGGGYNVGDTYRQTFSYVGNVLPKSIDTPKEFSFAGYGAVIYSWQVDSTNGKLIVVWRLITPATNAMPLTADTVSPSRPTVRTSGGYVKYSPGYGTPDAFAIPVAGIVAAVVILAGLYLVLDKTEKLTNTVTESPTLNVLLLIGAGFLVLALIKQAKG